MDIRRKIYTYRSENCDFKDALKSYKYDRENKIGYINELIRDNGENEDKVTKSLLKRFVADNLDTVNRHVFTECITNDQKED